jgi:hypothetical protein
MIASARAVIKGNRLLNSAIRIAERKPAAAILLSDLLLTVSTIQLFPIMRVANIFRASASARPTRTIPIASTSTVTSQRAQTADDFAMHARRATARSMFMLFSRLPILHPLSRSKETSYTQWQISLRDGNRADFGWPPLFRARLPLWPRRLGSAELTSEHVAGLARSGCKMRRAGTAAGQRTGTAERFRDTKNRAFLRLFELANPSRRGHHCQSKIGSFLSFFTRLLRPRPHLVPHNSRAFMGHLDAP